MQQESLGSRRCFVELRYQGQKARTSARTLQNGHITWNEFIGPFPLVAGKQMFLMLCNADAGTGIPSGVVAEAAPSVLETLPRNVSSDVVNLPTWTGSLDLFKAGDTFHQEHIRSCVGQLHIAAEFLYTPVEVRHHRACAAPVSASPQSSIAHETVPFRIRVVEPLVTSNSGEASIHLQVGDGGTVEEFSGKTGSALISFDKDLDLMHWVKAVDFGKLVKAPKKMQSIGARASASEDHSLAAVAHAPTGHTFDSSWQQWNASPVDLEALSPAPVLQHGLSFPATQWQPQQPTTKDFRTRVPDTASVASEATSVDALGLSYKDTWWDDLFVDLGLVEDRH